MDKTSGVTRILLMKGRQGGKTSKILLDGGAKLNSSWKKFCRWWGKRRRWWGKRRRWWGGATPRTPLVTPLDRIIKRPEEDLQARRYIEQPTHVKLQNA